MMSRSGQTGEAEARDAFALHEPGGALIIGSFAMPSWRSFGRHEHDWHQIAWAAEGVLLVEAAGATWVLPPPRALWIPAGVPHATSAHVPAKMRSPYLRPDACPVDWTEPTVINVSPLLRQLILYLADPGLDDGARVRGEAVVHDLVEPAAVGTAGVAVPMPADARALRVAEALLADPADGRTLDAWGRLVGASGRTLARTFEAETGMSFGRWRTQVRMRAALGHLAEGLPVTSVAHRVGYVTPSAFVAVFRRAFGVSPARYFQSA
ncbi:MULTISPECIES: AraC family transcriptional regulator [Actinomadura]|uniref:AraC family transcriptional regulator n=1 Tax=Actinomadura yumaensis TaxID=111807 RepID=A0ABW2CAG6_9ACTN|nr:helix-turn-helix transcriptional regulator [Actinomadura sp. J1-007]